MSQNWRTEVDAQDYFGHQRKQLSLADRRPVIRRPSDLVGPGIAQSALRVEDLNDPLATYNGYFSIASGGLNAPTGSGAHVGFVSSDVELGGVQLFTNLSSGVTYRRTFVRNAMDLSSHTALIWSAWAAV